MQMKFLTSTYRAEGPEERPTLSAIVFKANAPNYLMESRSEKDGGEEIVAKVVNAQEGFQVRKSPKMKSFFIEKLTIDKKDWAERIRYDAAAPLSPFSHLVTVARIADFIKSDSVTLKTLQEREENGHPLMRLEYVYRMPDKPGETWPGWFVFDRRASWALVAFSSNYPGMSATGTTTYRGNRDDVPLVDEIDYRVRDRRGFLRIHWKVLDITPGPVDEGEFSLENYRISRNNPPRISKWLWGLNILLVAAAIFVAVFRLGAKRFRKDGRGRTDTGADLPSTPSPGPNV